MKPYYQDSAITLYCGDCREILPDVRDAEIVLTSPPYNVGLKYQGHDDEISDEEFWRFNSEWTLLAFQACADSARFYSVIGDQMIWRFREVAERAGWTFGQMLVWCKPNLAGRGSGKISGDWNHLAEWIPLFRKGKRTPMLDAKDGSNTHSFFVIPSPQRNWNVETKRHPAQWPLELPRRILSRTPGQVVLDPFCGSGSSLIAARMMDKQAIGIEKSEADCEIAAQRCEIAQPALFTAPAKERQEQASCFQ